MWKANHLKCSIRYGLFAFYFSKQKNDAQHETCEKNFYHLHERKNEIHKHICPIEFIFIFGLFSIFRFAHNFYLKKKKLYINLQCSLCSWKAWKENLRLQCMISSLGKSLLFLIFFYECVWFWFFFFYTHLCQYIPMLNAIYINDNQLPSSLKHQKLLCN